MGSIDADKQAAALVAEMKAVLDQYNKVRQYLPDAFKYIGESGGQELKILPYTWGSESSKIYLENQVKSMEEILGDIQTIIQSTDTAVENYLDYCRRRLRDMGIEPGSVGL